MERRSLGTSSGWRARTLAAALAVGALLAGCSGPYRSEERYPGEGPDTGPRIWQVARAWDASLAARAWRDGFFPLDPLVRLPAGGWRSAADRRAYERQDLVFRSDPAFTVPSVPGTVRWADGRTLELPVMPAVEAYRALAPGGGRGAGRGTGPGAGRGGEGSLVVTRAELGELAVRTSRGPARVPAWQFTVAGYDTPLVRVAVDPSPVPKAPIGPAGPSASALSLVSVSADGRVLTLSAGHGACDGGARVDVLEGIDAVVLEAGAEPARRGGSGNCPAVLLHQTVEVTLASPLAGRTPVDAHTGGPVAMPGIRAR
ncbi:hypothetical protein [Streptomyces sp. NRRL S-87]|uniref:hypothetical protein n=1 Tax=Streptomyces sp. NRRL S-87 TaxID=1463920 RepID=UPI0004C09A62|nr:hypothetical protein [Streptomyces sp. NRRL S-87]